MQYYTSMKMPTIRYKVIQCLILEHHVASPHVQKFVVVTTTGETCVEATVAVSNCERERHNGSLCCLGMSLLQERQKNCKQIFVLEGRSLKCRHYTPMKITCYTVQGLVYSMAVAKDRASRVLARPLFAVVSSQPLYTWHVQLAVPADLIVVSAVVSYLPTTLPIMSTFLQQAAVIRAC